MQVEISTISTADRPLVVELDAILRSNLLHELIFSFLGKFPFRSHELVRWARSGSDVLKTKLSELVEIDPSTLPYDKGSLMRIAQARASGRPIYLTSAFGAPLVRKVADHLELFDACFSSDARGEIGKTRRPDQPRDENKFAYVPALLNAIGGTPVAVEGEPSTNQSKTDARGKPWIAVLRPHQWAKNALVGVPLLTAHQFTPGAALLACLAIIAFCACASSVYVLNDLVDIQADRSHPTKRNRPFARGDLSLSAGGAIGTLCILIAFAAAAAVSVKFFGALVAYLLISTAYSLMLKRKLLVDVLTLAALYVFRVLAGAVAIEVPASQWLLGFAMFMFLSLALIKRYTELAARFDAGLPDLTTRGYRNGDLPVIGALAAASGFSAVLVFSLYLASDTVQLLYSRPTLLWLMCPLLIYWTSRILMFSHRRALPDDPIAFALRDRISWATGALIALIGIAAI